MTNNRCLFDCVHEQTMRGEGVLLSWTDCYQHTSYSQRTALAALKSFIMSPWTNLKAIDRVVQQIISACQKICPEHQIST